MMNNELNYFLLHRLPRRVRRVWRVVSRIAGWLQCGPVAQPSRPYGGSLSIDWFLLIFSSWLSLLSMFCELLDILLSSSFFPSFPFQVHPHRRWSHVQRRTMAKLLNMRSKNLTGDMSPSYVVYMDIKIFYYSDYKTVLGYNFTFA